jgi:hypothetical protein
MFTRNLPIATTAAALLALASLSFAAEEEKDETHHMHVTIDHQVETAKTAADHEAIAKRFEDEAADLEKQVGEHERLAKRYHSGIGVGPKTNAASLATHCDNFVKNLRASANDAREMARLHRDMGKMMAK